MTIFDDRIVGQWEHHTHAMTFDEGIGHHSTRVWLFNFRRNAQWVLAFRRYGPLITMLRCRGKIVILFL